MERLVFKLCARGVVTKTVPSAATLGWREPFSLRTPTSCGRNCFLERSSAVFGRAFGTTSMLGCSTAVFGRVSGMTGFLERSFSALQHAAGIGSRSLEVIGADGKTGPVKRPSAVFGRAFSNKTFAASAASSCANKNECSCLKQLCINSRVRRSFLMNGVTFGIAFVRIDSRSSSLQASSKSRETRRTCALLVKARCVYTALAIASAE